MNLFELVRAQLSDAVVGALAASVGESESATRSALSGVAVPAVLAGVAQRHAGAAGVSALLELLRRGGHDGAILGNLASALSGGAQTDALVNTGKGLLGALLAGRADAVEDLMASQTGIRRGSAATLLAVVVPLVLNCIGREVQSQHLTTDALALAISGLPNALNDAAAPGLASAMGLTDFAALAPAGDARPRSAIWPWLLVPAVALSLFFGLRSCQQTTARAALSNPPSPTTPQAPPANLLPGAPNPAP